MKHVNAFGQNGDHKRSQVDAYHQRLLLELQKISDRQGQYWFEGKWRTPEEALRYYQELQSKHRWMFCEVMILCLCLTGLAAFLIVILHALYG